MSNLKIPPIAAHLISPTNFAPPSLPAAAAAPPKLPSPHSPPHFPLPCDTLTTSAPTPAASRTSPARPPVPQPPQRLSLPPAPCAAHVLSPRPVLADVAHATVVACAAVGPTASPAEARAPDRFVAALRTGTAARRALAGEARRVLTEGGARRACVSAAAACGGGGVRRRPAERRRAFLEVAEARVLDNPSGAGRVFMEATKRYVWRQAEAGRLVEGQYASARSAGGEFTCIACRKVAQC